MRKFKVRIITYVLESENKCLQIIGAVTFRGRANHYYKSSGSSYEQAEAMNQRALAGYEKVLEVDHPDTLTSV